MAFSPMGNGFLSGKYRPADKFEGNDLRRVITRFSEENMKKNQPLPELLSGMADSKGCTSAQIAPARILKKYGSAVPIPGMRKRERIDENLGAAAIRLSEEEYASLTAELDSLTVYGDRKGSDIAELGSVPDYIRI